MDLKFVAPHLRQLDGLKCEAMFATWFSDERPLRGVLGLVDWRLCGHISRLVRAQAIAGTDNEQVLVAARPRLSFEKLFLLGLGPQQNFSPPQFDCALEIMLRTLRNARVRTVVMSLPGRSQDHIPPQIAMGRFLRTISKNSDFDSVFIVENPTAQKAMLPIVEMERRRERAAGIVG